MRFITGRGKLLLLAHVILCELLNGSVVLVEFCPVPLYGNLQVGDLKVQRVINLVKALIFEDKHYLVALALLQIFNYLSQVFFQDEHLAVAGLKLALNMGHLFILFLESPGELHGCALSTLDLTFETFVRLNLHE